MYIYYYTVLIMTNFIIAKAFDIIKSLKYSLIIYHTVLTTNFKFTYFYILVRTSIKLRTCAFPEWLWKFGILTALIVTIKLIQNRLIGFPSQMIERLNLFFFFFFLQINAARDVHALFLKKKNLSKSHCLYIQKYS